MRSVLKTKTWFNGLQEERKKKKLFMLLQIAKFDKVLLLRYLLGSMISNSFGIKQFQTNLPSLARKIAQIGGHYLVTKRGKPVFMAIPFEDYQEIEDIIAEANSAKLAKDIKKGRIEFMERKTKKIGDVIQN